MSRPAPDTRADWEARLGLPSDVAAAAGAPRLPAAAGLRTIDGRGQVTLDWGPVDGAIGYVVLRSRSPDGPFTPVDTGGPDVMAVPGPPFADTTGRAGEAAWYAVAPISAAAGRPGDPGAMGARSDAVRACPRAADGDATVRATVDVSGPPRPLERPWRPMVGSEHLSQLLYGQGPGGHGIGEEFAEALRLAHRELGIEAVRAHSILHDELGVYREVDGRPVHDFTGIDRVYDRLLETGMRPIVELGYMPRDLARDPGQTVFDYRAIISPPHDYDRWEALVRDLAAHLVERYGPHEVRRWAFEVWNEANLEVFWGGTLPEYLELYDRAARAVKRVDRSLRVGGPATAAVAWIEELLAHCARSGAAVDFVSTHTYGNVPLDLRPALARHGFDVETPIWWTEWGVNAAHFNPLHDSAYAAAFLVHGMVRVMGRLDALAYWVVSDHFEEFGRPPRLLHGGFGLLSVGSLRKPRWWALQMLESLGDERLAVDATGDGAGSLVDLVATRSPDGTLRLLACNATIDHAKATSDPLLARRVTLELVGLPGERYWLRHLRVDADHSNIGRAWDEMRRDRDWPDAAQWQELRRRNVLEELEPRRSVERAGGRLQIAFELPLPAVSLLELSPG